MPHAYRPLPDSTHLEKKVHVKSRNSNEVTGTNTAGGEQIVTISFEMTSPLGFDFFSIMAGP